MSSRQTGGKRNGLPRRRRQLVIKERNISADEFMAASIGDVEWLDQSLRDGKNPSSFDKNGLAPIHLAALHGRLNCLQLLVEKYGVDVNLVSSTGWTPLHLCINRETGPRAIKCLNYLLENDADVDSQNDDCVTPAHQAASEGLVDCMKILIEKEVDLTVTDVRGHLPVDLAKLWSHKHCARIIRAEMWKRMKQERAEEMKQLNIVKAYYSELQKEAVHQLKNEQEFYGGVAFGNWLDERGLPENLKNNNVFQRERYYQVIIEPFAFILDNAVTILDLEILSVEESNAYLCSSWYPDTPTEGLSKRLRTSGGLEDCAERMEVTTSRQQQKKQFVQFAKQNQVPVEKSTKVVQKQTQVILNTGSKEGKIVKVEKKSTQDKHTIKTNNNVPNKIDPIKQVVRVERVDTRETHADRQQQQKQMPKQQQQNYRSQYQQAVRQPQHYEQNWENANAYTPYSEITTRSERPYWRTPWNFSTNLESDPVTNIKCKDTVALSIHPDETERILPKHANLTVKLETIKKPKIKMMLPGGRIKSADIRMPDLPSSLISDVLSGVDSDRIRIPQEFKAVHVHDLKKKRQPDTQLRPKAEIGMHLSILGDPRILRKFVSDSYETRSPLSTLSANSNNLPSVGVKNFNRTLNALHRMNPPHAFLA